MTNSSLCLSLLLLVFMGNSAVSKRSDLQRSYRVLREEALSASRSAEPPKQASYTLYDRGDGRDDGGYDDDRLRASFADDARRRSRASVRNSNNVTTRLKVDERTVAPSEVGFVCTVKILALIFGRQLREMSMS